MVRKAHRMNPCTSFCIHLGHCPTHSPAPSLCLFRLVFPPKPLLFTQVTRFLVAIQALEQLFQRQWTGLSRWVSVCRSLLFPFTCLNYNFFDTSRVFVLCAVKLTILPQSVLLGRRRITPKEGAETSYLPLTSPSPFGPNLTSLSPPL